MNTATLAQTLDTGLDHAIAIAAPHRSPLTYGQLRQLRTDVYQTLTAWGLSNQRIAVVLENGPELATAVVTFASLTTVAPLNPAYRTDEWAFYLTDLGVSAVVVDAHLPPTAPVIEVAQAQGIAILTLHRDLTQPAGLFWLQRYSGGPDAVPTPPPLQAAPTPPPHKHPDDLALLLHTSGTTSRPKQVALTQGNLSVSARQIAQGLHLTSTDRCLNILPLFHIHGLVGAVMASFSVGASVYCTPGFNALKFLSALSDAQATWYTAVPTMHQAIVARAERARDVPIASSLRFIRSASAPLSPQLAQRLEHLFHVPVIECYGMTEAAHQIASNPLPPGMRRFGTVGVAVGTEIVVVDPTGQPVPPGVRGEVVIRGPNVMTGYLNNPQANADNFMTVRGEPGWLRTGDQGFLDDQGYLTLTGRLKELINRGGEKIAPREIDEVLLDHPAVEQAVAFAMAHERLGEEVAAAVVLREGQVATEAQLRAFVATRLAEFKVPRRIVLCEELPKGPTGKVQRIGLARKLGL